MISILGQSLAEVIFISVVRSKLRSLLMMNASRVDGSITTQNRSILKSCQMTTVAQVWWTGKKLKFRLTFKLFTAMMAKKQLSMMKMTM